MIKFLHGIMSGAQNDTDAQRRQALQLHLPAMQTHILHTNESHQRC
jgi:hypothetical protein